MAEKYKKTTPNEIEAPESSYLREDMRWEKASQVKDWIILLIIASIWFIWMLLAVLLEPGIR
jgi:hypothetical protein